MMESQTSGSSPFMDVNCCFLVLPILQIIASPPRQTVSFWTSSSQSVECLALQILRHLEVDMPRLIKHIRDHEECVVCASEI